LQLLQ